MSALDRVERGEEVDSALEAETATAGRVRVHSGLSQWTRHAVLSYLEACGGPDLTPLAADGEADASWPLLMPMLDQWILVRDLSRADERGVSRYEMCTWGRRYESADGSIRELRIPVSGSAEEREADKPQVAMAAQVLARGVRARLPDPRHWGAPATVLSTVGANETPVRIRIVRVGCLDASVRVLFDGSPEEAAEMFERHGRAPLAENVGGSDLRPGHDCATCHWIDACPAVGRVRTLIVSPPSDGPKSRRTWSMSDGLSYRICAARQHLNGLRLPRAARVEHPEEVRRGHAVHAWLKQCHDRIPARRCVSGDVPADPADWLADRWQVTGEQAIMGAGMIAQHARYCPVEVAANGDRLLTEHTLVAFDELANVVIVAKPDLLYVDHEGAWVYRETKTRARPWRPGAGSIFDEFPQTALAVALLAEGVPQGCSYGRRVELEILSAGSARLVQLDATDGGTVEAARRVVHDLTSDWVVDAEFRSNPGEHCTTCSVAAWCPDRWLGAPDPLNGSGTGE